MLTDLNHAIVMLSAFLCVIGVSGCQPDGGDQTQYDSAIPNVTAVGEVEIAELVSHIAGDPLLIALVNPVDTMRLPDPRYSLLENSEASKSAIEKIVNSEGVYTEQLIALASDEDILIRCAAIASLSFAYPTLLSQSDLKGPLLATIFEGLGDPEPAVRLASELFFQSNYSFFNDFGDNNQKIIQLCRTTDSETTRHHAIRVIARAVDVRSIVDFTDASLFTKLADELEERLPGQDVSRQFAALWAIRGVRRIRFPDWSRAQSVLSNQQAAEILVSGLSDVLAEARLFAACELKQIGAQNVIPFIVNSGKSDSRAEILGLLVLKELANEIKEGDHRQALVERLTARREELLKSDDLDSSWTVTNRFVPGSGTAQRNFWSTNFPHDVIKTICYQDFKRYDGMGRSESQVCVMATLDAIGFVLDELARADQ